jgi:hypothetical protein
MALWCRAHGVPGTLVGSIRNQVHGKASGTWSIAAVQDLVYRDQVAALDQLIGRLVKAGFLETSLPPEE